MEEKMDPCLVCSKGTEKFHLQVQICYGCAAFYRRSIKGNKKYRCKRANQKCQLTDQTLPMCRLCRFNRCQVLNLSIYQSKVATTNFDLSYNPNFSDPCNIPDTIFAINSIFKSTDFPAFFSSNNSGSYYFQSIANLIDSTKPRNNEWILCKADEESINIRFRFFNNFVINSAKLLASCPSFRKLSIHEKLLIHSKFWQKLLILRNAFLSCENFDNDEFKVIIDNCQYLDPTISKKFFQIDPTSEGTQKFIFPMLKTFNFAFSELKKFKPTLMEFCYICIISLWSFNSFPQLSELAYKMGDKIIAEASAKLHEYYTNDLRTECYAHRQAQLFKFANIFEHAVESKNEMLQAWKIFNFGRHAFSYCKFETSYFIYKPT